MERRCGGIYQESHGRAQNFMRVMFPKSRAKRGTPIATKSFRAKSGYLNAGGFKRKAFRTDKGACNNRVPSPAKTAGSGLQKHKRHEAAEPWLLRAEKLYCWTANSICGG